MLLEVACLRYYGVCLFSVPAYLLTPFHLIGFMSDLLNGYNILLSEINGGGGHRLCQKFREMKKCAYIRTHLGRRHRSHGEVVRRWDDVRLATRSVSCSWNSGWCVCGRCTDGDCLLPRGSRRAVRWRRRAFETRSCTRVCSPKSTSP